MIPPPDRHAGDRARVELDYDHAAARMLRILQHPSKYTNAQHETAWATYQVARKARERAYKEWYKELEGWANGIGGHATRDGGSNDA